MMTTMNPEVRAALMDLEKWDDGGTGLRLLAAEHISKLIEKEFAPEGVHTFICAGQEHEIIAFTHLRTGMVMHLIPGGTFRMGNLHDTVLENVKRGYCTNENIAEDWPQRPVTVGPFLIGRFVITEGEWKRGGGKLPESSFGEAFPVNGISRTQAMIWLRSNGLRLPSDSEWEFACRAGSQKRFFWGDEPDLSFCWNDNSPRPEGYGGPEQPEVFPAALHADKTNAFGLIDVLGNVSEWVRDDFYAYRNFKQHPKPFVHQRSRSLDPFDPDDDDKRPDGILRGGHARSRKWGLCSCASRTACGIYADEFMGVRAVFELAV